MIFSRYCSAILLLFLLIALGGCAAKPQIPATRHDDLYNQFRSTYSQCNATGIKAKASLYYTSQNRGHRTTMTIWGEFEAPLRLDVRAGIGAYIAHIREDGSGLTAFYPDQETAYSHVSPVRAVQILGLPFPFSLKDLAGLIAGCYQSLIPQTYDDVSQDGDSGKMLFTFDGGPVSSITLTDEGVPSEITGRGEIAWRMEMSSYEQDPNGKMLPQKIAVYTDQGDKAILRIKSRSYRKNRWTKDSLEMDLPEGTEKVRLDGNGYVKID